MGEKGARHFVIRVDASVEMGTGHVMRCLTIAEELRNRGGLVSFICRQLPGNGISLIQVQGFPVFELPFACNLIEETVYARWLGVPWEQDAYEVLQILKEMGQPMDWLIVDHYALDHRWESNIRDSKAVSRILVVDDLADRRHDCDLLLDQNFSLTMDTRYLPYIPVGCKVFIGPQYALFRQEFYQARKNLRQRHGKMQQILLFFGGTDPTNETEKALNSIQSLPLGSRQFVVVVGKANPYRDIIEARCRVMKNASFFCQVNNLAELMASADLALGAGGTAALERAFLGLPSLTIMTADNQVEPTQGLADLGMIRCLGRSKDVDESRLAEQILWAISHPEEISRMEWNALMFFKQRDASQHPLYQALWEG